MTPRLLKTSLAVLVALVGATPALAQTAPSTYLAELSCGTSSDATAQYVAIYTSSASNLVGGKLSVEDSNGAPLADFAYFFSAPPVNGQGYVLVATQSAATAYQVNAAQYADNASLVPSGGRLCLVLQGANADCVAWGQYNPNNNTGFGTPVVNGTPLGQALKRISFTNDNATDWQVLLTPDPTPYQALTPPPDGGVTTDAGGTDGGTDGGTTDGGTTDGGVTDGGTPDGGGGTAGGGSTAGPMPDGTGQVPIDTSGCSSSPGRAGGSAAAIVVLGLGLVALRRRRSVDPDRPRR